MSSSEIPKNWVNTPLIEIADIVTGKTPSKKNPEFFEGPIPFIKPGDVRNQGLISETDQTLSLAGAATVPTIPSGSITVTCIGNLGRIAITQSTAATNQQINSVIPSQLVSNKYLYYYLRTLKSWMESAASATTVTIINKGKFSCAPILLPPLNEQTRIANKLDNLLAKVDAAQARLDKIPTLLKRFRQSVLAAATSGELTREWREALTTDEQWKSHNLATLCNSVSDGDHQAPPKADEGIPFLVISNVSSGKIEFGKVSRWVPQSYFDELKSIRKPELNDILYTVTGSFGIPIIVNSSNDFCFQRHIAILKPKHDLIDSRYLSYFLEAPATFKHASEVATGTAQKTVSLTNLRNFVIQVPCIAEQKEIVRRVESLFTLANTVEKQYQDAKQRIDRLTQSILAKAFRGELVAQDPNDEPASELLKRIQAEREAQKPVKKTRKIDLTKHNQSYHFSDT